MQECNVNSLVSVKSFIFIQSYLFQLNNHLYIQKIQLQVNEIFMV